MELFRGFADHTPLGIDVFLFVVRRTKGHGFPPAAIAPSSWFPLLLFRGAIGALGTFSAGPRCSSGELCTCVRGDCPQSHSEKLDTSAIRKPKENFGCTVHWRAFCRWLAAALRTRPPWAGNNNPEPLWQVLVFTHCPLDAESLATVLASPTDIPPTLKRWLQRLGGGACGVDNSEGGSGQSSAREVIIASTTALHDDDKQCLFVGDNRKPKIDAQSKGSFFGR